MRAFLTTGLKSIIVGVLTLVVFASASYAAEPTCTSEVQNGAVIWICQLREGDGLREARGISRDAAYRSWQEIYGQFDTEGSTSFGTGLQDPALGGLFEDDSKIGTTPLTNLEMFVSRMIGLLTVLAGVAFILYFVLGAFSWVVAGGDSGKVQKARDQMVQGVLGLIVIVAAYAIIGVIGSVLGIKILEPDNQLRVIFGIARG